VRYYSQHRDQITDREVDPYHLTHFESGLDLVAHCHLRDAVLIFAVDRMRRVDLLRRCFEWPAAGDVARYLAGSWGIVRGDLVTVRVVFAAALARDIRERLWHPSHAFRDLDGGRLEMILRVADMPPAVIRRGTGAERASGPSG
jgi:predicted DNA-binding transcriptional regulator YafY